MTHQYSGNCRCTQISFSLVLPNPLEQYQPRACDCEFCTTRHVTYLSDFEGSIVVNGVGGLKPVRQGSEQAEFQICSHCDDVVLVTYSFSSGLRGAVNASLLDSFSLLDKPVRVSPKTLSPEEKLIRWQGVWLRVQLV